MPPSSKPSPKSPGVLLVVSGPSGVGKTTILEALAARRSYFFSVSVTTRKARPGERDAVHYHFVDDASFNRLRASGELLEWAEYSGFRYGTPREPVFRELSAGNDVVCDVEIQGAQQIKTAVPESVTIFIMPPSLEELERRLSARADTGPEQIAGRLAIARSQIDAAHDAFDHLVTNDEVEAATDEIERILVTARGPLP